jgi:hypothetical protein
MAGLSYAADKCDAVITIDADLQDDINAFDAMVDDFAKASRLSMGFGPAGRAILSLNASRRQAITESCAKSEWIWSRKPPISA